jgi:hypothetical protein
MSCHTSHCHPSGLPQPNNECCDDVKEYTRFAYSSAQSAYANAQNAQQSAEDAATTLANVILLTGNSLPVYADNAAAISGGLAVNSIYQTSTGELRIVV